VWIRFLLMEGTRREKRSLQTLKNAPIVLMDMETSGRGKSSAREKSLRRSFRSHTIVIAVDVSLNWEEIKASWCASGSEVGLRVLTLKTT